VPSSMQTMYALFHGQRFFLDLESDRTPTGSTVRRHQPPPITLCQLEIALQEEWNNIPQERIHRLIQSMPWRCRACVCSKCWTHSLLTMGNSELSASTQVIRWTEKNKH
jgi:hypothetical protein